jgi:predicted RNA binding protein YcfA (HicA-like mRNA interferase family)
MLSFKQFIAEKRPVIASNKIETNKASLVKRLKGDGWESHGGTNHEKFKHPTKKEHVIVLPYHRDISIGVARQVHQQAGYI